MKDVEFKIAGRGYTFSNIILQEVLPYVNLHTFSIFAKLSKTLEFHNWPSKILKSNSIYYYITSYVVKKAKWTLGELPPLQIFIIVLSDPLIARILHGVPKFWDTFFFMLWHYCISPSLPPEIFQAKLKSHVQNDCCNSLETGGCHVKFVILLL